ncbi:MAG TPA: aromatic acid exporter family protein [Methylomirabilota bacterium]|nr:aromatic acid exporter family protein [Methylomirabilota bacterium]
MLAFRAALAAGLSVALAWICKFEYPIYALIAAVIVTDLSHDRTSTLGSQRVVATVVGSACGASLRSMFQPNAWLIGLAIFVAMLICYISRVQEGAKVAGYICGIIIVAHGTNPWSYALLRLKETVLGIAVAWLVSFLPRLIQFEVADSACGVPKRSD